MGHKILLLFTISYTEPDKSIPSLPALFYEIHFNIILPYLHTRSN